MRVERLSQDKVRIFLTFDDLTERGIQKDDMWRDIPKVHELFNEMMDQAYSEVGFEVSGPVAVEVFALPAQGMVVIVTKGKLDDHQKDDSDMDHDDDLFELEVTLEESDFIVYRFLDFEYLIRAAKSIHPFLTEGGTLFHYKDKYYLFLNPLDMEERQYATLIAILSEFGEASTITPYVLDEYGKKIIEDDAVNTLNHYF
jgi:adapter protein MecA 1/2